jgi:hypothetical protein
MSIRPRPLIAVRLVGSSDVVAAHRDHLIEYFRTVYGPAVICRTSTRHASHVGECRTYLNVTTKEPVMPTKLIHRNENPPTNRRENAR